MKGVVKVTLHDNRVMKHEVPDTTKCAISDGVFAITLSEYETKFYPLMNIASAYIREYEEDNVTVTGDLHFE